MNDQYPNHISELDNPRDLTQLDKRIQDIDTLISRLSIWHNIYENALSDMIDKRTYSHMPEMYNEITSELRDMIEIRENKITSLNRKKEALLNNEDVDIED